MPLNPHLSELELVQAIDQELPPPQAALAEQHLNQCWRCRARRNQLEQAMSEFAALHSAQAPSSTPPEALLRARLRAESPHAAWSRTSVAIAAAGLAVAVVVFIASGRSVHAGSLPDVRFTPGAVRPISRDELCRANAADDRAIPGDLAARVFRQYGIEPRPKAYEVDYLISPSLGGADDIRNLWPQPYDGVWTARVKDALEDHLRGEVCAGRLDLPSVQREIAGDWIASYRRRFAASRPRPEHKAFVKDRPWE
ncbi:MAG: hypothetical protein U0Q16_00595 [Bryobacteraceae bacterium]